MDQAAQGMDALALAMGGDGRRFEAVVMGKAGDAAHEGRDMALLGRVGIVPKGGGGVGQIIMKRQRVGQNAVIGEAGRYRVIGQVLAQR